MAIQLVPADGGAYGQRSFVYLKLKKPDLAGADLKKWIELQHGDLRGLKAIGGLGNGFTSFNKAQREDVQKALEKLAETYSQSSMVNTFISAAYLQMGNYDLASKYVDICGQSYFAG